MKIGYFLSSEEYSPDALLRQARQAEEAGFEALWISDHYHPWNDQQGHSPFVWSMIGALSPVCGLPVTTAVTCPMTRIHPAVLEMLKEAVGVMRSRWNGGFVTHRGRHYRVENARIYTLPDTPPPVYVSGFGIKSVPSPRHIEQASELVTEGMTRDAMAYGSDVDPARRSLPPVRRRRLRRDLRRTAGRSRTGNQRRRLLHILPRRSPASAARTALA